MKAKYIVLLLICAGINQAVFSQKIKLQYDKSISQAQYAATKLREALQQNGYTVTDSKTDYEIVLTTNSSSLAKEAFSVLQQGSKLQIDGGDARGLIYGTLAVAEQLRNGIALKKMKSFKESSKYPFRGIKYDLPWDTYRHSPALDLHYETCRDLKYWEKFLDMMVANRFNTLTLWNLHPYTFMIKPKNFPEASPFNDVEMKQWQDLFHGILRMAKERGLETYLFPFNIFVSPEFAKAHNVAMDNLEHHFFVNGDTSQIVKQYTRECVTQVLQEYPELTGFGLTHGEGMGGMTPAQRDRWISDTIIEGMRLSNRKTKLVHRLPLSAGTGSGGSTSIENEKLTRKNLEYEGNLEFLEGPIWADMKYNWSHAHSTNTLMKVHGGKLYDTFFNPVSDKFKVIWTARNEDFFCLRWGVPDFIRTHIATNSQPYVGGYILGSETYIPAVDYFTVPGMQRNWQYAFERQWLFYELWGRLLYNPETPDDLFKAEFTRRYGKQGENLLEAHALAGTTPLLTASYFDFTWDFTLYSEGFLALNRATGNVDYMSVDRQINQAPLDPKYISIKNYVTQMNSGGVVDKDKITPLMLADTFENNSKRALSLVQTVNTTGNTALLYEVADIKTWANLGLYQAAKLRGGVALQRYRLNGDEKDHQLAITELKNALRYWDEVVSITRPIYKDMPLVHFSEQKRVSKEEIAKMTFHWEKVRVDVAHDVEVAQNATPTTKK